MGGVLGQRVDLRGRVGQTRGRTREDGLRTGTRVRARASLAVGFRRAWHARIPGPGSRPCSAIRLSSTGTAKPAPTTWLAARLFSPLAPGGCIASPARSVPSWAPPPRQADQRRLFASSAAPRQGRRLPSTRKRRCAHVCCPSRNSEKRTCRRDQRPVAGQFRVSNAVLPRSTSMRRYRTPLRPCAW